MFNIFTDYCWNPGKKLGVRWFVKKIIVFDQDRDYWNIFSGIRTPRIKCRVFQLEMIRTVTYLNITSCHRLIIGSRIRMNRCCEWKSVILRRWSIICTYICKHMQIQPYTNVHKNTCSVGPLLLHESPVLCIALPSRKEDRLTTNVGGESNW